MTLAVLSKRTGTGARSGHTLKEQGRRKIHRSGVRHKLFCPLTMYYRRIIVQDQARDNRPPVWSTVVSLGDWPRWEEASRAGRH